MRRRNRLFLVFYIDEDGEDQRAKVWAPNERIATATYSNFEIEDVIEVDPDGESEDWWEMN